MLQVFNPAFQQVVHDTLKTMATNVVDNNQNCIDLCWILEVVQSAGSTGRRVFNNSLC